MIAVSTSLEGASLEDTEGLGEHLMAYVPDANDYIRRILPQTWYPRLTIQKRLGLLRPAVEFTMETILERLKPITYHLNTRNPGSLNQDSNPERRIETCINCRMEHIPERAILEGAKRMGITVDQMRQHLRDRFRKGLQ